MATAKLGEEPKESIASASVASVNGGGGEASAESDSDEDENKIIEESPCGRWSKRKEQVKKRDVPGIDFAYLAMDNETGQEVVWNEVQFSERKNFRQQEDKIHTIFENLTSLHHPNLVTFHKYWIDSKTDKPRVIFITEYMSSNRQSIAAFLRQGRRKGTKNLAEERWKRWCTQILSGLTYLHSMRPPITHGNLNCNTIYIQSNGLIKIGCVAPTTIHHHVKTVREQLRNLHYFAPEYQYTQQPINTAIDVYAFGMCALEMAVMGLEPQRATTSQPPGTNGDGEKHHASIEEAERPSQYISKEMIRKTIDGLENPLMRDCIEVCLRENPAERPTARELLFHPVLFEVHSLKLLAAHTIVNANVHDIGLVQTNTVGSTSSDTLRQNKSRVYASSTRKELKVADLNSDFEIDKLLEDVRNGIYPLTAFASPLHRLAQGDDTLAPAKSPQNAPSNEAIASTSNETITDVAQSASSGTNAPSADTRKEPLRQHSTESRHTRPSSRSSNKSDRKHDFDDDRPRNGSADGDSQSTTNGKAPAQATLAPEEKRRVKRISAEVKVPQEPAQVVTLVLLLKLEDGMNRQLTTEIDPGDNGAHLARELVVHGFINEADVKNVQTLLDDTLGACRPQATASKW